LLPYLLSLLVELVLCSVERCLTRIPGENGIGVEDLPTTSAGGAECGGGDRTVQQCIDPGAGRAVPSAAAAAGREER